MISEILKIPAEGFLNICSVLGIQCLDLIFLPPIPKNLPTNLPNMATLFGSSNCIMLVSFFEIIFTPYSIDLNENIFQ